VQEPLRPSVGASTRARCRHRRTCWPPRHTEAGHGTAVSGTSAARAGFERQWSERTSVIPNTAAGGRPGMALAPAAAATSRALRQELDGGCEPRWTHGSGGSEAEAARRMDRAGEPPGGQAGTAASSGPAGWCRRRPRPQQAAPAVRSSGGSLPGSGVSGGPVEWQPGSTRVMVTREMLDESGRPAPVLYTQAFQSAARCTSAGGPCAVSPRWRTATLELGQRLGR